MRAAAVSPWPNIIYLLAHHIFTLRLIIYRLPTSHVSLLTNQRPPLAPVDQSEASMRVSPGRV